MVDWMHIREIFERPSWRRASVVALAVCTAALAWLALNEVTGRTPQWDSAFFTTAGRDLLAGKVLYRDIWDTKPPFIFFLNALAVACGKNPTTSVWVVEHLFAAAMALAFFATLLAVFGSRRLAVLGTLILVFCLYRRPLLASGGVLDGGNLTEEYAVPLVQLGVLATWLSIRGQRRRSLVWAGAAGLAFASAALFKEPFVLAAVPWFAYLVYGSFVRDRRAGPVAAHVAAFVAGVALPVGASLLYLVETGAWAARLDIWRWSLSFVSEAGAGVTFFGRLGSSFARATELVFGTSVLGVIAAALALLGLLSRPFLRRLHGFPVVAAAALATNYWATSLSVRHYPHYYMQLAAPWALVLACGLAFADHVVSGPDRRRLALVPIAVGAIVLLWDYAPYAELRAQMHGPFASPVRSKIGDYIASHSAADEPIWVPSISASQIYIDAQRTSPSRFYFFLPVVFDPALNPRAEKDLAELRAELAARPPSFVAVRDGDVGDLRRTGIWGDIAGGYDRLEVTSDLGSGPVHLYARKKTSP